MQAETWREAMDYLENDRDSWRERAELAEKHIIEIREGGRLLGQDLDAAVARAERAEATLEEAVRVGVVVTQEKSNKTLIAKRDAALARVKELEAANSAVASRLFEMAHDTTTARIAELESRGRQAFIDWTDMEGRKLKAEARVAELERAYDLAVNEKRDRIAELEGALREAAEDCECRCHEAWTGRVLHEPSCMGYLGEHARAVRRGKP